MSKYLTLVKSLGITFLLLGSSVTFSQLLKAKPSKDDQVFKIDVNSQTPLLLKETQFMVFNHSGSWDGDKKSFSGVRNMISAATQYNISRIAMIDLSTLTPSAWKSKEEYLLSNQSYFFQPNEIDLVVGSDGGPHQLEFANATKIFFAGGFLDLCLCEAIRDTLRWTDAYRHRSNFEIYIVRDAVYDAWANGLEIVNLEDKFQYGVENNYSDKDFVLFNDYISHVPGCGQNYKNQKPLDLNGITLNFFVDNRYATSFFAEGKSKYYQNTNRVPQPGSINVHFIHSKDLDKYIN